MYLGKSARTARTELLVWLPIIVGLGALYIPSLYDLFNGVWSEDEQAHGPIVLAISCWLIYRKWPAMLKASNGETAPLAGWTLLAIGLFSYVIGRSQAVIQLEIGAVLPVLIGLILIMHGAAALKKMWFPLFFMLFMIPLPGVLVQTLTIPLKTAVSIVAEHILYAFDYPIARTGVILRVGQYQMLVADACAGLHTLFTLEALGLLYMNLMGHESLKRNLALASVIVPISFISNVIRVMVLVLITYHFGDAAGQGFLHGFAGMTLFLSALLLIIAVDALLGKLIKDKVPHAA
ncbi:MAG: exosortase B [Rhodoferax ferrireducens]|uniref:Exosortase B n=2 Tax=Pseudomonadota TaxID=1224 RepID=A0A1Y1R071_9GAMM|nr:MAG: exosortase B [Rhodoferax ferrireducens]OQX17510.1 MAG: exosortase B [Thiothrix lacustris]